MSESTLNGFEEIVGALEMELATANEEKSALQLQLTQLQASQVDPAIKIEAIPGEVELLKSLLEKLATELGNEKLRSNAEESRRQSEEEKMLILLSTLEESRKALARLQAATMPSRRSSTSDNSSRPRRPSLLGAVTNSQHRRSSNFGLGFGLASRSDADARTSTLGSKTHQRHISETSTTSSNGDGLTQEAARTAKLRARELGLSITLPPNVFPPPSKSGARSVGIENTGFDFSQQKRRLSSVSLSKLLSASSISESSQQDFQLPSYDDDLPSTPPSAPLRALGRNQSFAFFDDFPRSRRGSSASSYQFPTPFFYTPPHNDHQSTESCTAGSSQIVGETDAGNLLTIQGLRIQLAESEEGRRANMVCIQALKDFIGRDGAAMEEVQLPQLPTDSETAAPAIWSMRFPDGSRRDSNHAGSPGLFPWARSGSNASGSSSCSSAATEGMPAPVVPACPPTFGGFSFASPFASLVGRVSPCPVERSPTMITTPVFETPTAPLCPPSPPHTHDESSSGSGSESDFQGSSDASSSHSSLNSSVCDDSLEVEKIAAASPLLGIPLIVDPTATV